MSSFGALCESGVPMDHEPESLRSCLRSNLGPRDGGVRDRSLVPFRAGERDRRSLFDGYPKKKNL